MREYRLGSTQPRDEHVTDRLIHRLPLEGHTRRIEFQVNEISRIFPTSSNTTPNSACYSTQLRVITNGLSHSAVFYPGIQPNYLRNTRNILKKRPYRHDLATICPGKGADDAPCKLTETGYFEQVLLLTSKIVVRKSLERFEHRAPERRLVSSRNNERDRHPDKEGTASPYVRHNTKLYVNATTHPKVAIMAAVGEEKSSVNFISMIHSVAYLRQASMIARY
ncbi:hypothetical protein FHL15_003173 [Xylaria flabelliformis]|uniref:Uncharacterized protein n=1 Tax=Xylaria flabelliformis TaxID=2512241 RepID=A0A553I748_9PEZI|nr:hypothetical protein FHL15_003173 [Xylaria flabelliformis]